jgi:23S rRNA (cytidine1920-2'-O)/16S rRNA (cytidine1409-2'-O)-methyltransferase
MRADQVLVQRGLAPSRVQAQRLLAAGVRWFDGAAWRLIARNADDLPAHAPIDLRGADKAGELRYVSRGGLKLESALREAALDPAGALCLDLGQSTGGFTDCLLRHGAALVVGVDVGHGQLAPSLRRDPRVVCIERVNARDALALRAALHGRTAFDLIVGDLSFISQTLVLPAARPLLNPGGQLLMLVKPQFELQPGQVGKGGIVRDATLYEEVRQRILSCCASLGLVVTGWFGSPITGGDGNREFFVHAKAPSA